MKKTPGLAFSVLIRGIDSTKKKVSALPDNAPSDEFNISARNVTSCFVVITKYTV